jgi:ankyrin repeat protein
VRELLARGANIEAPSAGGGTSLLISSQTGHLDVVRELLCHNPAIDATTHDGTSSLLMASYNGHAEVVRELLANGANKLHHSNVGHTARSVAGLAATAPPGSRAAIRALLAAAP